MSKWSEEFERTYKGTKKLREDRDEYLKYCRNKKVKIPQWKLKRL